MIEIRTFDGTAEELSDFVVRTWRLYYEGKMPVPLWGAEFLRWTLELDSPERPYVVAAYDGSRLVACHPGRPIAIRLGGEQLDASLGSFLSVDPEYQRQGIAGKMHKEFARRHQERGAVADFGYLYLRYTKSLGKQFWLKQPASVVPLRRVGQWLRAFDHRDVARWELWGFERWGTRLMSLWQSPIMPPRGHPSGIRAYRREDLADCLELIAKVGQSADLAYVWDEASLDRQLSFNDLANTVVLEQDGRVAGLVNFCRFDVLGRFPLPMALVDLVAFGKLSASSRRRLMQAAMCEMVTRGLKAAFLLRGCWYGWSTLLEAGFYPMRSEYHYVATKMQDEVPLGGIKRLHVLWR